MNSTRLLFLLLALPTIASAAQVQPVGNRPTIKKRWFLCRCTCKPSCLRSQEEREREQELARIDGDRKQLAERISEDKKKVLLRINSQDAREAYAHTVEYKNRRATGNNSDPEHLKKFMVVREQLRAQEKLNIDVTLATNAALSVASTARAVSPAPMSPPGLIGSLSSLRKD